MWLEDCFRHKGMYVVFVMPGRFLIKNVEMFLTKNVEMFLTKNVQMF